jgi:3,4-dihydroxy 2-butanone 4-phosphate synthase/GTP cyclohydrolase II
MARIAKAGLGVLVYLHQSGQGFRVHPEDGLRRLAAHERGSAQQTGGNPLHETGLGAQILSDLGLHTIRLLTNHPRRVPALEGFGIEIAGQEPVPLDERAISGTTGRPGAL